MAITHTAEISLGSEDWCRQEVEIEVGVDGDFFTNATGWVKHDGTVEAFATVGIQAGVQAIIDADQSIQDECLVALREHEPELADALAA